MSIAQMKAEIQTLESTVSIYEKERQRLQNSVEWFENKIIKHERRIMELNERIHQSEFPNE